MELLRSTKYVSSFFALLEKLHYSPGDTLRGVVEIVVEKPVSYTTLEACIIGEEITQLGVALMRRIDMQARHTTFYRQNIILAGDPPNPGTRSVSHEEYGKCVSSTMNSPAEDSSSTHAVTKGLTPGTYTFPFSVQLPDVLPPSYVDKRNSGLSKLSYHVRVKLLNGKRLLVKHKACFSLKMLPVNPKQWIDAHMNSSSCSTVLPQSSVVSDGMNGATAQQNLSESNAAIRTVFIDHCISLSNVAKPTVECDNVKLGIESGISLCSAQTLEDKAKHDSVRGYRRVPVHNWTIVKSADHSNERKKGEDTEKNWASAAKEESKGKPKAGQAPAESGRGAAADDLPAAFFKDTPALVCQIEVPMYCILKKGFANVCLTVFQVIGTYGTPIRFCGVIDNTKGVSPVKKITFRLVNRTIMRSLVEEHYYGTLLVEKVIHETVPRGQSYGISETQLVIPTDSPLTLLTPGYSSRIFLEVKLSYGSNLVNQSGVAGVEIAVVDHFVDSENSQLCGQWTNYYGQGLKKKACSSPDIFCSFTKTGAMKVIQAGGERDHDSPCYSCPSTASSQEEIEAPGGSQEKSVLNFDEVVYCAHPVSGVNPLSHVS
ncbi:hypothetical protein TraAM80_02653 [Trypanosoma rangeli]|uniref:Arrestin-like N-terminal domain-containing protein n=1 Tax=Trypanosoma rangeli TaxID=5698 RepID=A0A3R7M411_TRYRA|nr:uncharacterized protein TraAM80_02653 [Trypanosoma rangeli]RNF08627.1 hypothetical protein TraAM80_02653 [Trypanosoma rangeli]|eukprot:RNF08627.1 hypothetical protein TraAM80_02653 [Trypanosoma rangeli]